MMFIGLSGFNTLFRSTSLIDFTPSGILNQTGVFAPLSLGFPSAVFGQSFATPAFNAAPNQPLRFDLELMVTAIVMLVVAAAVMPVLLASQRQQTGQESRVDSLDRARDTMERITRESREAARVDLPASGATGQILTFRAPVVASGGNELRLMRYDCSHPSTLGSGLSTAPAPRRLPPGRGPTAAP